VVGCPLTSTTCDQAGTTGVAPGGSEQYQSVELGGVHRRERIAQPQVEHIEQLDGRADRPCHGRFHVRAVVPDGGQHTGHRVGRTAHPGQIERDENDLVDPSVRESPDHLRARWGAAVGEREVDGNGWPL